MSELQFLIDQEYYEKKFEEALKIPAIGSKGCSRWEAERLRETYLDAIRERWYAKSNRVEGDSK